MILDPWFWFAALGACALFWSVQERFRGWVLALTSAAYLVTLSPTTVCIALTSGLLAFALAGRKAHTAKAQRRMTRALLVVLLGVLAFWKYTPELSRSISDGGPFARLALPLGLSFYVFRLIHYVIERGRGSFKDDSLGAFLGYLFLLPIFSAGPIERYDQYTGNQSASFQSSFVSEGLTRIFHGLVKKLLLADALVGPPDLTILTSASDDPSMYAAWRFLVISYAYAYLDFSGYSDLAIGICRLYGIRISENFNWPIFASSVGDFWKRWHISLAAFTQRYVYMPVLGRWRNPYLAVVSTFLAMGLWHSASLNYLAWALLHSAGVAGALTWSRLKRVKGWTRPLPGPFRYWGVPATFAFMLVSFGIAMTSDLGIGAAARLLGAAFLLR